MAQLQAQLRVAELPARDPQRIAAEASLAVAEANADRAREDLADRISVLHQGRLIAEGDRDAIRNNSQVNDIYLGAE